MDNHTLHIKLSDPKQREVATELIKVSAEKFLLSVRAAALEAELAIYALKPGEFRNVMVEPLKIEIENCLEERAADSV